jgi:SAM-dependent methyltransferase
VAASAEATTLPDHSVDLITAAQAFHWFEPPAARREFVRILRPGGRLALIWNERETDTTPFQCDYEHLLQTLATDYERVSQKQTDESRITAFFAPATFERFTKPSEQRFDLPGLIGRSLSSSYAPNRNHPDHGQFVRELTRIFQIHAEQGMIAFRYQTRLYLGRLE